MPRYVWFPVIFSLLLVAGGYAYVKWTRSGEGSGLYSRVWKPATGQGWWDPDAFYKPPQSVKGEFSSDLCIQCHESLTPGIVNDWRASGHARTEPPVTCDACHGNDHERLHLPTPRICGGCHEKQHGEFLDEARYGFPSHVLAMERALEAKHFVDKPKAEVQSCLQCHSVATKCDSCHTRHRFDPAEARRSEACITCHSGPPHPDDETYFASAHGRIYREEGASWDWKKPLIKGNYKAPTCAYCHMDGGNHQVAHKSLWKFGLKEINPKTSGNEVMRERWIKLCNDCHTETESRAWLEELDKERRDTWSKLYAAEDILKSLRSDDLLHPGPGERPAYPQDLLDRLWPRARIGFYEGQASSFYNVSAIERDYFEMWYFDNLGSYKAAAHNDSHGVIAGQNSLDSALSKIRLNADELRALGENEQEITGRRTDPGNLWLSGPYTEFNREQN
ncbi:MAG: hydroxylamine oxidoreductase [Gammaproteobacteria bacterium]|nr:MAG: hydroxylamine oxidoreductase [Gammaproteobacteria bacterium]